MEYEYEVRGEDSMELRIRGERDLIREEVIEALKNAGDTAEAVMEAEVPRESGKLARSIHVSGITFRPGGFGGGGFWEIEVNVGKGVPYLQAVIDGTGEHGPKRQRLYPAQGNAIRIHKKGEGVLYRASQEGQLPQDEWISNARIAAEAVLAKAVASLGTRQ